MFLVDRLLARVAARCLRLKLFDPEKTTLGEPPDVSPGWVFAGLAGTKRPDLILGGWCDYG